MPALHICARVATSRIALRMPFNCCFLDDLEWVTAHMAVLNMYSSRTLTFIAMLVCVVVVVLYPVFDYDLYWHLANGREMLSTGHIVNEERFSYTALGTPFSNHEWLSQIIFFLIYAAWGGSGLLALKVLLALMIAVLQYRTCRLLGASAALSAILVVAAVTSGLYRYIERPELFSLLGVSALSYLLYSYRAQRSNVKFLYVIPIILVLWNSLHGAIFGLIVLCAFVTGENIKSWIGSRFPAWSSLVPMSRDRLRALNIVGMLALAAMLLDPYGLRSYDVFLQFINGNALVARTVEFQPANWREHKLFWVLLGASLFLLVRARSKIDITLLLMAVPFAFLAVRYSRVIGVFSLVDAALLASLAPHLFSGAAAQRGDAMFRTLALSTLALTLGGYVVYVKFVEPQTPQSFGYRVSDEFLPAGSVRFIQEVNLQGNLYNSGGFGGYLAFFITPQRRIFQYNHHTVFGDTKRYLDHPEELAQWQINYAVVGSPTELEGLFPQVEWARVYRESSAVVVVRRTPENSALIERYEIFYFHPMLPPAAISQMAQSPEMYLRLMYEIAIYLSYRADTPMADLFAELLFANHDLTSAERLDLVQHTMQFNSSSRKLAEALTKLSSAQ